ncbi:hypothetical protein [Streptomyces albidoflavus]|uniref:hypothetical protein n=1 Tax=Streptomyces albidoflavus TaxID=1886 RepID=UPI0033F766F5
MRLVAARISAWAVLIALDLLRCATLKHNLPAALFALVLGEVLEAAGDLGDLLVAGAASASSSGWRRSSSPPPGPR